MSEYNNWIIDWVQRTTAGQLLYKRRSQCWVIKLSIKSFRPFCSFLPGIFQGKSLSEKNIIITLFAIIKYSRFWEQKCQGGLWSDFLTCTSKKICIEICSISDMPPAAAWRFCRMRLNADSVLWRDSSNSLAFSLKRDASSHMTPCREVRASGLTYDQNSKAWANLCVLCSTEFWIVCIIRK